VNAPRVRRVALTGGIATGKSYVRGRFEADGIPTIDADTLARAAVAPGTSGLAEIVRRFGAAMLDSTGALDRKKLAAVVFSDPAARRDLEAIVHPFVRTATNTWFASLNPTQDPFAVADIPLLFETGRDADFDAVVVAACAPETQLARLMARDGIGDPEARLRIAAQLPLAEKIAKADYVIRTDGSFADTDRQVGEVITQLRRLNSHEGHEEPGRSRTT
jgi:dephospho-CoA kinase